MIELSGLTYHISLSNEFWMTSNIKFNMLEAIANIVENGMTYNQVEFIDDIIKTNCEESQEERKVIRNPYFLIYIAMAQVYQINESSFTLLVVPTMWNFQCFVAKWKRKLEALPPKTMFIVEGVYLTSQLGPRPSSTHNSLVSRPTRRANQSVSY